MNPHVLFLFAFCVFQTIHKNLYISETVPITAEHKLLFTTPSIPVVLLQPVLATTTYTYSIVYFSLNDISQTLIDCVRRIASLPLAQITMANADVFFVIKNGPENILKLMNASSSMYVDNVSSHTDAMEAVSLGLTVGSVLLLTFVMCVLVRPPVYDVERNKENVLILFLDVPAAVVRDFQRRCAKHLNQLVSSNDDNADDGALDYFLCTFIPIITAGRSPTNRVRSVFGAGLGVANLEDLGDIELDGAAAEAIGTASASANAGAVTVSDSSRLPAISAIAAVAMPEVTVQSPALTLSVEPLKAGADEASVTNSQQDSLAQIVTIDKLRKTAKRHRQRDYCKCDMALLRRHYTMIKIAAFLLLAIVYFTISYWVDFGSIEPNLRRTPYEVWKRTLVCWSLIVVTTTCFSILLVLFS